MGGAASVGRALAGRALAGWALAGWALGGAMPGDVWSRLDMRSPSRRRFCRVVWRIDAGPAVGPEVGRGAGSCRVDKVNNDTFRRPVRRFMPASASLPGSRPPGGAGQDGVACRKGKPEPIRILACARCCRFGGRPCCGPCCGRRTSFLPPHSRLRLAGTPAGVSESGTGPVWGRARAAGKTARAKMGGVARFGVARSGDARGGTHRRQDRFRSASLFSNRISNGRDQL